MTRDVSPGMGVLRRVLFGATALAAVGFALPFAAAPSSAAAGEMPCAIYAVRGAPHSLFRVDSATGESTLLARLPVAVNSIGYAGTTLLAIARLPKPWLVRLHVDGTFDRIAAVPRLASAYAATVRDGVWYALGGDTIHSLGISGTEVSPPVRLSTPAALGDWDFDPEGRFLLGISTARHTAVLVGVDPRTGRVVELARPAELDRGGAYGEVWVDPVARTLTARHNGSGRLFRIALDDPSSATLVSAGPSVASADAAFCAAPPPPASALPSPSSSLSASPPLSPSAAPSRSPSPSGSFRRAPTGHSPAARPAAIVVPRRPTPREPADPPAPVRVPIPPPPFEIHAYLEAKAHPEAARENRMATRRRIAAAAAALTMVGLIARGRLRTR